VADAITRITDVIDPEILAQMVLLKLPNNTILIPGVFTNNEFAIGTEGTLWEIPYNNNLGELATYQAGMDLTIQKLTQDKYRMVVIRKATIYAADKIVRLAAFKDPMDFVATQLATQTIPKMYMDTQILILEGAIPAANRSTLAATITLAGVRAAKLKLGDKMSELKHILMHSKVYGDAENAGIVVYQPVTSILPALYTGTAVPQVTNVGLPHTPNMVATIAGLIVHISDNISALGTSPETYPCYLLGDNAMGHFWQQGLNIDLDRDVKAKEDWISPDIDFTMCLHGVDYTSTSYTDANLQNTANYTLKWNQKLVTAVRLTTQ
jgi:PIN domain nuclease of toxin-antitoxin system